MSKETLKKLERITFYIMLALLPLTIVALLLHLKEIIGIGLSGFFALAALICSAVHRACVNRITGKTVFGKKLDEKMKKKSK